MFYNIKPNFLYDINKNKKSIISNNYLQLATKFKSKTQPHFHQQHFFFSFFFAISGSKAKLSILSPGIFFK